MDFYYKIHSYDKCDDGSACELYKVPSFVNGYGLVVFIENCIKDRLEEIGYNLKENKNKILIDAKKVVLNDEKSIQTRFLITDMSVVKKLHKLYSVFNNNTKFNIYMPKNGLMGITYFQVDFNMRDCISPAHIRELNDKFLSDLNKSLFVINDCKSIVVTLKTDYNLLVELLNKKFLNDTIAMHDIKKFKYEIPTQDINLQTRFKVKSIIDGGKVW